MSNASSHPLPVPANPADDSAVLQVLMETIPDRIYFKDLQSRFVRNNSAHARSLGAESPAACVGKSDRDFFSAEHAARALADEQEIIRTRQPLINKIERTTLLDGTTVAWVSTTKLPWFDAEGRLIGTLGITRDVTAAHAAEEQLLNERNLLRTIIDHLPSRIFVKDRQSRYLLNNAAHLAILGLTNPADAVGRTILDFFPGPRGQQAFADDQQVIASEQAIINQEKSDFGPEGNVRWALTTKVPLRDLRDRVVGLVGISHDITKRKLTEEELQRRTDQMEADLRMARQIQDIFLPHLLPVFPRGVPPEASALQFAHRYVPASTLGGDFFDILQLSDTLCGVIVCDVMGHGVRAGLLTALIRGVLGEIGGRAENPTRVLSEINRTLAPILEQTGQPVFATAFYGVIDTARQRLVYANAGHPAPALVRCLTRTVELLSSPDPEPAAGLVEGFRYTRHECPFLPGDTLIGFTDGVFEAANAAGECFGEDRLRDLLARHSDAPCAGIPDVILAEVERFTHRVDFEDDLCIVAIQATGSTCALEPPVYDI